MKRQAPLDTSEGRATGETDLQFARQLLRKSGVVGVVSPGMETGVGRPRVLSLEAFLEPAQMNARERHGRGDLGCLHGDSTTVEFDGEAAETQLMEPAPTKRKAVHKAKVLGVGRDGRKQYTVDPGARVGHRSATNSRPAGPYIGFELHLAVQTRDVKWTDGIERTSLGPEVAGVVTSFSLVAAGTHRGRAVVDDIRPPSPAGTPSRTWYGTRGTRCAGRGRCTTASPR